MALLIFWVFRAIRSTGRGVRCKLITCERLWYSNILELIISQSRAFTSSLLEISVRLYMGQRIVIMYSTEEKCVLRYPHQLALHQGLRNQDLQSLCFREISQNNSDLKAKDYK